MHYELLKVNLEEKKNAIPNSTLKTTTPFEKQSQVNKQKIFKQEP